VRAGATNERRREEDAGNGRERVVGGGEESDIDAGKETNRHRRPCISTPIRVINDERRNITHHWHERKERKERT
jgi:hypothetical protein